MESGAGALSLCGPGGRFEPPMRLAWREGGQDHWLQSGWGQYDTNSLLSYPGSTGKWVLL